MPVPNFATMSVSDAQRLAFNTNRWTLWQHLGPRRDYGPLLNGDAGIRENCEDNPPTQPRPTGAALGVILDTEPPPAVPLRGSAAAAATPQADADPEIPDFGGMSIYDAQILAYVVGRWVIKVHKGENHYWPDDYSAVISSNCPHYEAGKTKATGGDLGVILDTTTQRRWLVRLLLSVVGGLIGGATSLGLARAFGFI